MLQQLLEGGGGLTFPKPVSGGLESLSLRQCWGAAGGLLIKDGRCLVETLPPEDEGAAGEV